MAISRMQQPRQMYGLGSFVKKAVRKITRPVTKVASKIVPKEIAGIMRTAAPFLPPGYREAAYLLGTAKQTGRISPVDLALTLAPTVGRMNVGGQSITDRIGGLDVPFTGGKDLREVLVGKEAFEGTDVPLISRPSGELTGEIATVGATDATSGIFGKGNKMFQIGAKDGPGILETKAGQTIFGKEKPDGTFKPSFAKIAGLGTGLLSAVTAAKTPEEAGEALVAETGNTDDYEKGVAMFSTLKPGIFDIPEAYRLNSANGGLMRTNYAQGTQEASELKSLMEGMRANNSRSYGPEELKNLFAGMRPEEPDFFKDLFLKREGGGGRDFMISDEAKTRDDLNEVLNYMGDDMAKAKELEANKIFEVLNDKTMQILDVVLDMPDSEEKDRILYDINQGILNKQKDSGMAGIANARYETIQKYGYLLDDKKRGLGDIMADPQNKADGGLMRTDYAMGSDDDKPVLPDDPTKPINPFGPKPIKPLGDMKMASDDVNERYLEYLFEQLLEEGFSPEEAAKKARELFDQMSKVKDKKGIMMAKKGGRANLALGSRPTAEESGLGGLPIEADMRYTGGFMPYGAKEKADDVPARLSKNEFVFTADAVRAAGGGSVNEGAKKMYATMKKLEKKPEAKGMTA